MLAKKDYINWYRHYFLIYFALSFSWRLSCSLTPPDVTLQERMACVLLTGLVGAVIFICSLSSLPPHMAFATKESFTRVMDVCAVQYRLCSRQACCFVFFMNTMHLWCCLFRNPSGGMYGYIHSGRRHQRSYAPYS